MQATGRGRPPGTLGGPQGGCVGAAGVRFMGTSMCVPHPNAPPKHIHTPMWGTCGGGGGAGGPRGEVPSSMSVPPPPPQAQSDTHVGDMWGRRRSRGTSRRGIMWNIGWASGRVRGTGRCPPPPPQAHSHTHGVDARCGRRGGVRLIPTPSTG